MLGKFFLLFALLGSSTFATSTNRGLCGLLLYLEVDQNIDQLLPKADYGADVFALVGTELREKLIKSSRAMISSPSGKEDNKQQFTDHPNGLLGLIQLWLLGVPEDEIRAYAAPPSP